MNDVNDLVIAVLLAMVALAGTLVALTQEPRHQAVLLSMFGLLLGALFFALQAPDVALSQIGVGTAVVPLMVMLSIRTIRRTQRQLEREKKKRNES